MPKRQLRVEELYRRARGLRVGVDLTVSSPSRSETRGKSQGDPQTGPRSPEGTPTVHLTSHLSPLGPEGAYVEATLYGPGSRALVRLREAAGEDEDCVRVTRMVGPDGRIYVTRGLICQD